MKYWVHNQRGPLCIVRCDDGKSCPHCNRDIYPPGAKDSVVDESTVRFFLESRKKEPYYQRAIDFLDGKVSTFHPDQPNGIWPYKDINGNPGPVCQHCFQGELK